MLASATRSSPLAGPWSADQLSRVVVSNLVGLAGVLASAYGAAVSDDTQTTLAWFNLSLVGLAVSGVANGLWLLRCRTAFLTAKADVLADLRATTTPGSANREHLDSGSTTAGEVVWAPGRLRYHRPGCALVAGRSTRCGGVDAAADGRIPCEVCVP